MGLRFDTVISSYIISLPFLFLSVINFLNIKSNLIVITIKYLVLSIYSLAFLICSIDIPFFNYYFSRLNIVIFNWTDNAAFGFKMILQEKSYLIFFFVFLIINTLFIIIYRQIKTDLNSNGNKINIRIFQLLFSIIMLGIIFLGIRGRIEKKSPIKVGTAYFSNYSFINQLGLNPVFTLVQSYIESKSKNNNQITLIDDKDAINYVNGILNIKNSTLPFVREVKASENQIKPNIILIMMESMSAMKMGYFGNNLKLTPFLDSISQLSYNFNNCYTSGIHTFNGIYSTLYSYPSILKKHTMNATEIP